MYVSNSSPELGEQLELRLRISRHHQPESIVLRTVRDGEPHVVMAECEGVVGPDAWWVARIAVRNVVTHYRWLLVGGAFEFTWLTAAGPVDFDVPDSTDFVITAGTRVPAWEHRSVIYQVFPDRFARSQGAAPELARAPEDVKLPAWAVPRAWTDRVEGRGPSTGQEYFGGDLDGVVAHLDDLERLGINVVYLTPIFPAESTHRYDATTFDHVDPLLGGDAALKRMNHAAHERGMKVIGDITLNHCGRVHEWFVRAQDPSAPEHEFFRFDPALTHGYECWFDVPTLPKFDHTSTELRQRLVLSENSPVRSWLRGPDGIDGWRVDVANMAGRMGSVDVTHEFARDVRAALALEKDDALLIAEHGHDASGDLLGDGWHGTMNYAGFTRQVWCWLRGPDFHETFLGLPMEVPVISGQQFVASIQSFHGRLPWQALISSWNMLGSHDTARIRSVVGTAERQIAAIALAVGLPGVPAIFAGDEIGAVGLWGEDARTPYPWHDPQSWDLEVLDAYSILLRLRRDSEALAVGGLRWVHVEGNTVAFVREVETERLLIAVSRHQAEPIRISMAELGVHAVSHLFGFSAVVAAEQIVIEVPSAGAGVWRLEGR